MHSCRRENDFLWKENSWHYWNGTLDNTSHNGSHHGTSNQIKSNQITSHHIKSHQIRSHHITSPHHITPHHVTPRHITHQTLRHIFHNYITSRHIEPHHTISQHIISISPHITNITSQTSHYKHHITNITSQTSHHKHHITSHHITSCGVDHVMTYHIISYIITCRPPPRITWKKNGQKITHGWNFFEIPDAFHGRLLKIINVKKDLHQDVYTCEAENSQNSGNPIVYAINLNVKGKLR